MNRRIAKLVHSSLQFIGANIRKCQPEAVICVNDKISK